jgi:hypothetical protein
MTSPDDTIQRTTTSIHQPLTTEPVRYCHSRQAESVFYCSYQHASNTRKLSFLYRPSLCEIEVKLSEINEVKWREMKWCEVKCILETIYSTFWPASRSSDQSFWLLIMRSRVRFPVLPWGFFLEGEDPRGDHGLGSLVELRFKAPPGISYSYITIQLIGTT